MKIAVIGAGAMGSLIGGYLSRANEVTLIDTDSAKIEAIQKDGIRIREKDGSETHVTPGAATGYDSMGEQDLVVLFVKSLFSRAALAAAKPIIGENTYVMTLQNGAGHDEILREFVAPERVVIGTTQHNASYPEPGCVNHGGSGITCIGALTGDNARLAPIAEAFKAGGMDCEISENVQKLIWHKLFTNVSVSALTGVLQTKIGYMMDDENGWWLCERLVREAVAVANGDGMGFDVEEILGEIRALLKNSHDGYTSIYADLRDGRRTEVDTISGAVVSASHRNGVPASSHEFIVKMVHAMENRVNYKG